jgi:hypothetical protein
VLLVVPLQLSPDGTVSAAAGGNLATTTAISSPILNALTGGAYKNRPTAATAAYTQIPLALCKYYWGGGASTSATDYLPVTVAGLCLRGHPPYHQRLCMCDTTFMHNQLDSQGLRATQVTKLSARLGLPAPGALVVLQYF